MNRFDEMDLEIAKTEDRVKVKNVWTNGRAIRAYTGQDKHYDKEGWYKAKVLLIKPKEVKKDE